MTTKKKINILLVIIYALAIVLSVIGLILLVDIYWLEGLKDFFGTNTDGFLIALMMLNVLVVLLGVIAGIILVQWVKYDEEKWWE